MRVQGPSNPDTYEINDSLAEDALWVNANVGEAMPDVLTPLTWSIIRALDDEATIFPGYYSWSGNICGRVYTNISYRVSAITTLRGWDARRGLNVLGDVFGRIPEDLDIPIHHSSRWGLVREMVPRGLRFFARYRRASGNMPQHLRDTPDWCKRMTAHIGEAKTTGALLSLWQDEIGQYNSRAWWALLAGTGSVFMTAIGLNERLAKLVGPEDANALLGNFRGDSELASLGPMTGIAKVARGEMSREEYLTRYGHRGPHEFELSIPHPAEDPSWLERQIDEFKTSSTDVDGLLREQRSRHEDARQRLEKRFPREAMRFGKQLAKLADQARIKEASRSEFTRVFRVVRAFALRAGELTGTGKGAFFLYLDEVLDLLSGDAPAVAHIPARIETYNSYTSLPPYPSVIRGAFDPFEWAREPGRRSDCYDATMTVAAADAATLQGFAGAAGRVEGRVRVLKNPEDGGALAAGEILVTTVTNVGWTPLFPRAAAVVTDVGAPLSHAAIVARELGIPAVVGCGNATMNLRTGDLVRVDGGRGTVEVLRAGVGA